VAQAALDDRQPHHLAVGLSSLAALALGIAAGLALVTWLH
jgi:hypothetical protein